LKNCCGFKEFIKRVSAFIEENENNDFWDDLSMSEQQEIQHGIADLDRGDGIEYKDFLKKLT